MGDDYDNGLKLPEIPKHHGAKSRWIIVGFHDPNIALLNRTVPTPETGDVPLALQMLASLQAAAWVGDVESAFMQGGRGEERSEPLRSTPPRDPMFDVQWPVPEGVVPVMSAKDTSAPTLAVPETTMLLSSLPSSLSDVSGNSAHAPELGSKTKFAQPVSRWPHRLQHSSFDAATRSE